MNYYLQQGALSLTPSSSAFHPAVSPVMFLRYQSMYHQSMLFYTNICTKLGGVGGDGMGGRTPSQSKELVSLTDTIPPLSLPSISHVTGLNAPL